LKGSIELQIQKSRLQEEVNEATVQFVGGGFGLPKTEDFLPEQKGNFLRNLL
jgi:hypothetical protein